MPFRQRAGIWIRKRGLGPDLLLLPATAVIAALILWPAAQIGLALGAGKRLDSREHVGGALGDHAKQGNFVDGLELGRLADPSIQALGDKHEAGAEQQAEQRAEQAV